MTQSAVGYITTPIYYVNAQPHLGHTYTTVVADAYARFLRLDGYRVRFQTGTDEHGEKIVEAAAAEGRSPREYVDRVSAMFRDAWPQLHVAPDAFIRTTDPRHMEVVRHILRQVYDAGDIYFSSYSGLYCSGCERFVTEKELVDGLCPDHRKPPKEVSEENYFFRMGRYQEWLVDHIRKHPEFITPERYRNEVLSFLSEPLEDLCISRPKTRLSWGIPLPFDDRFVTYVWFDALINYITGIGYPDGDEFPLWWKHAEHVIAKDILKPHAIYWPTMLRAMGLEPYWRLHVHGYWNIDNAKMSKSLGNVVRPRDLVECYGADAVRYCLLREMSFGLDASFSSETLESRYNSDLANDLGNLFSRSMAMIAKYDAGTIYPVLPVSGPGSECELKAAVAATLREYRVHMHAFSFHRALQAVWEVVALANRYIVANAPWELAKDETAAKRLREVLSNLAEALRCVAVLLSPVMPETAAKMLHGMGLAVTDHGISHQGLANFPSGKRLQGAGDARHRSAMCTGVHEQADNTADSVPCDRLRLADWWQEHTERLEVACAWGGVGAVRRISGTAALFPRLEKKKQAEGSAGPEKKKKEKPGTAHAACVGFDDFARLDLKVAEIVTAEPVPKSRKLLKLLVRAPEERTIVAGIAESYAPGDLVGKKVVIVANLQPAILMGVTSHGMVLAAKHTTPVGDRLELVTVGNVVPAGTRIS